MNIALDYQFKLLLSIVIGLNIENYIYTILAKMSVCVSVCVCV